MSDEQKKTIEDLYQRALDLPSEDRAAFIKDEVPEPLRGELETLIANYEAAQDSFLNIDDDAGLPEQIGPFRIVRLLGEGGMGNVYLAEQYEPIERLVALKVIKPGMDSVSVMARFQAERQALARMDHPAIATVYEAGTTDEGRPYFAMEFVPGSPITTYADEARLTPRERVELFIQVCNAIQYAHQKGIIHRDIKPTNVIVSMQSGELIPKVIDFGIAKAVEGDLLEEGRTQAGQLVGTPEYMSPEQAGGKDIDTRTDVYALGLLLYELLVGALPFDPAELRASGVDGMMRFIREFDPPRPSTRISSLGDTAVSTAHNRRTAPKSLTKFLRGDLDWIVLKSLEKDRTRRYDSVADFATDLRRYLADEPVTARPPSATYRVGKFVRRNRAGVAIVSSVFVALIAIAGVSLWQSQRVAKQRDLAQQEAQVSREVADQFAQVFHQVGIQAGSMKDATLQSVLETGVESLHDPELNMTPGARIRLLRILGDAYSSMAQLAKADTLISEALLIADFVFGPDHIESAECRFLLVPIYRQQSMLQETLETAEKVLPVFERELGPDDPRTLRCVWYIAGSYNQLDLVDQAMPHYNRLITTYTEKLGPDHARIGMLRGELGVALANQYRYDDAIVETRAALGILEAKFGEGHLFTLNVVEALCRLYPLVDEPDTALMFVDKEEKIVADNYPPDHSQMGDVMLHRAIVFLTQGKYEAARDLLLDAQPILATGSPHSYVASAELSLGIAERELADYEASRRHLHKAIELYTDAFGADHPSVFESRCDLALTEIAAGNPRGAEDMMAALRTDMSKVVDAQHPLYIRINVAQGAAWTAVGQYSAAERALLEAREALRERSLRGWYSICDRTLVALYEAWDRPQDADKYRAPAAGSG